MNSDININDLLYEEINNQMKIDIQNHIATISQSFSELQKINEKPIIILIGQSGVGKSSLINSIFQENVAVEGEISQTTEDFTEYSTDKFTLFDSKGFSSTDMQTFTDQFTLFLKELDNHTNFFFVWFIINSAIGRLQPFEEEICKKFLKNIPVCFVLNKSDISSQTNRQQLKKTISELGLNNCLGIFEVISGNAKSSLIKIDKCLTCNEDELVYKVKTKTMMCIKCMEEFSANSQHDELIEKTLSTVPIIMKSYFISTLRDQFKMKDSLFHMEMIEFATKIIDWNVEDTLDECIQIMKSCAMTFGFKEISDTNLLEKIFALLENVNKGITKKIKSFIKGDGEEEKTNGFCIVLQWYRMIRAIWINSIQNPLKSISSESALEIVNEAVELMNITALESMRIKLESFGIEVLLKDCSEWEEEDMLKSLLDIKINIV